jgi:hypothetical protein
MPSGVEVPRARQRRDVRAFPVGRELVLLAEGEARAFALNETGAALWALCDGSRTLPDVVAALSARYVGDPVAVALDIAKALSQLQSLGLVEFGPAPQRLLIDAPATAPLSPADTPRAPVRFVVAFEDRAYFHWQIAILLESLVGQLPVGWDVTLVVCNDHRPLSAPLAQIIHTYGVRAISGDDHSYGHPVDLSGGDSGYVALHRVEGLKAMAHVVENDDIVCLMDTDVFLYKDLRDEVFPVGNAMAANVIIAHEPFLSTDSGGRGIDLQGLLATIGCDTTLKPGGVTVFLEGAAVRNEKFVQDCFRFGQTLYLLGKATNLSDRAIWMSEMACFALAAAANEIEYRLLDAQEFSVPGPNQEDLPPGSFFHYYVDINDGAGGPFRFSHWHKQLFRDRNFLNSDLESFRVGASSPLETSFFDLAIAAKRRLGEIVAQ